MTEKPPCAIFSPSSISAIQISLTPGTGGSLPEDTDTLTANETEKLNENVVTIKSPIIGTFYTKPSPDKKPYISVGSEVKKGDVLCVIEAMKLFNEIESDIDGKILKVLVEDSTPVEFDEPLFLIEPI